jgi:hypothetical protein
MNKITGMIVAAILVLIVGGIVLKSLVFPSSDSPTLATTGSGFMEVIEVNADISSIVKTTPSGAGNAAEHYSKAIELLFANYDAIQDSAADLAGGNAKDHSDALKIFETIRGHVATGAKQASMDYMTKYASGKLQVSTHQEDVERLDATLSALDILGDYYVKNKRFKDAEALYRDIFVAGWHMINERSQIQMTVFGVNLQNMALNGMIRSFDSKLDKNTKNQRIETLKTYNNALDKYRSQHREKMKIFRKALFDAGDIWNIAENDKDRAWRVQAILAMALIRFTHDTSKANTARNNALIERFLNSDDPLEKAAAEAAKAYTDIDFNQVGSTW